MTIYSTRAVSGPSQIIRTGVGPRNPLGLPTQPTGARTPPTPAQPMSAAGAYSTSVLPGPAMAGFRFLPSSPVAAQMGQPPPIAVTPVPSTTRDLPTVTLSGGLYQGGVGGTMKSGHNVMQAGPAPMPHAPTTPPTPNYAPGQMAIRMTGGLHGI